MLEELFNAICKKATEAQEPSVAPYDQRVSLMFRSPDGVMNFRPPERPPIRQHLVGSIEALAEYAEEHKLRGRDKDLAGDTEMRASSCWACRNQVVLFPDDVERDDAVMMRLAFSKPLITIMQWEKNPGVYDQKQLQRLLRVDFRNCLPEAQAILDIIKQIRWGETRGIESSAVKGKSSLGKSLHQEFVGLENLPDFLTFQLPVFSQGFVTFQRVECYLEPNEGSTNFTILPTFGQVEAAVVAGELALIDALKVALPEGLPVYHGQPRPS